MTEAIEAEPGSLAQCWQDRHHLIEWLKGQEPLSDEAERRWQQQMQKNAAHWHDLQSAQMQGGVQPQHRRAPMAPHWMDQHSVDHPILGQRAH